MSDRAAAYSPLIAITVADPARSDDPALAARKNELYAAAIARHGGTPALLHGGTPPQERDRLLAPMDGLLLAGGADIDPAKYGETANGAVEIDRVRDELELSAWRAAERRSLPVLGICRGLQAVNVFSGGKLLADVPSHAGTPYGQGPAHTHDLEIDPATRLGRAVAGAAPDGVAGGDSDDAALQLQVNSFHHQAVSLEGLAPGLRSSAWAYSEAGRLVEGLESPDGRWIVAVQCHPERTESTPDEFEGLWEGFIQAARAARAERAPSGR
ncbi:MAG: gamma-glutamyl-gamma-aminobutyrate hydrolase family protein [Candidatus Limnocylindrales bacterium]|jgi:gamma-glutamyl-gamma-aminobutyrate hydrolase PuuD